MKAKEVLKLLKITRPTLCKYVKTGLIKTKTLPSKQYIYDEESVFKLLDKNLTRSSVGYCRVSTIKQKNDLNNQQETVVNYCNSNGIQLNKIYKDISSGINFDRKEFQGLLNDVIQYKISRIYITYKDRLSRISFDVFKELFSQFNCEIIVINNMDDEKTIKKEIFTEIIDLIHCFSMKMYSERRKNKLNLIKKELELENEVSL